MAKEAVVREEVSATISRKLDKTEAPDSVKQLLRRLLVLELEHRNERASWYGYKDEYEAIIGGVAERVEGEDQ